MDNIESRLRALTEIKSTRSLRVKTLGTFEVDRSGQIIEARDWGRDKTIQLFQFLITARHRRGLHKEQIISRLWEEADDKGGDRDFKVALHGINKILEPERKSRSESKYILRQGLTYQLRQDAVWIDAAAMEDFIAIGNEALNINTELAILAYKNSIDLHHGVYLPNRLYEDWTSAERERLQLLILGTYITLGELLVEVNPMESIRLSQEALQIDSTWEDAYRIQMKAYLIKGNRPLAIKTYQQCKKVLDEEFGIDPLPETQGLLKQILGTKAVF